MNAAVERIQHVARSRDAEHDISRCHDIQLQVLKCFKKILIWWCRLFSWELTIKINNFEITDLHMLIHASVRTQENNFGSKLFSCGVQTSGHRKIIFMGGEFTRTYLYVKPQEKKVPWLFEGVWFFTWLCKKGTNTYVQLHQPKKWLQEAEAQVSKIKSKGLDLFWLNTCGWSSKVGPTGKKSHHQADHPQIGHDGTNSRIVCQHAPKLQNTCFLLKIHLPLQKGTTTYVQLHQPKKWLEEAEAQVSKIKSKGLDLFLAEYMRVIFKGWPHRQKVASPGQSSTDRTWWDEFKNFVSTRPNCKICVFFLKIHLSMQKGANTYVQLHQPKKLLQEAKAQGSKIKSKGLDLFWLNACGWSSKVGPTGKKSHHKVNHPQIGYDVTNSKFLCQRAPKLQNTCFFAENTFALAKGYNHICSASPTKKVTSRGRDAGNKNKIQGAGPFFGWIFADDLHRLAPQEKSRITRSTIHR